MTIHTTGTRAISVSGPLDFFELQRVKNAVWGPDATAILVFPPQSHLRTGPLLHLWRVEAGTVPDYDVSGTMPERYPGAPCLSMFGGRHKDAAGVMLAETCKGRVTA